MSNGTLDVRPATGSDLQSVRQLLSELGYEVDEAELGARLARAVASANDLTIVCTVDTRTVGLLHAYARFALEKPMEAVVQALVVNEAFRKAGVGRNLMAAAERWAAAQGCRGMVVYTRASRAPARAFYRAVGFRDWAETCRYRKILGSIRHL